MRNEMNPPELPHSPSITDMTIDVEKTHWNDARKTHITQMARIAEQLARFESYATADEPTVSKLTVRLEWYRYESDIYIDGYTPDSRYSANTYEITSVDLVTTWLGVLARQPKPLKALEHYGRNPRALSVRVSTIAIGDDTYSPREPFQHAFDEARSVALDMIPDFLAQAAEANRYKDLPVAVDQDALVDMEARLLILFHCQERDSNFFMRYA